MIASDVPLKNFRCDTCRRPPDVNRQRSGWQSSFMPCHARILGVRSLPQPQRALTSVWCSCRGSALEIHRREACERPVSLRFSALRPRIGTNQQCDAREGLVWSGKTGVSTALNAVRERSAVKVACSVLRGPCFRKGARLPTNTVRTSEATSFFRLLRRHPARSAFLQSHSPRVLRLNIGRVEVR